jgi:hypothetical protein
VCAGTGDAGGLLQRGRAYRDPRLGVGRAAIDGCHLT